MTVDGLSMEGTRVSSRVLYWYVILEYPSFSTRRFELYTHVAVEISEGVEHVEALEINNTSGSCVTTTENKSRKVTTYDMYFFFNFHTWFSMFSNSEFKTWKNTPHQKNLTRYISWSLMNLNHKQSDTKPNLIAKILATKFGGFFVIHVMFSKICSIWV